MIRNIFINKKFVGYSKERYILPSFMILGQSKCGTSSLVRYILMHRYILPPKIKENGWWNKQNIPPSYNSLVKYAKKYFPCTGKGCSNPACMSWVELVLNKIHQTEPVCRNWLKKNRKFYITFDSTATYLTQADPAIIHSVFPNIRFIVILRCPIRRAFSHYKMHIRFGRKVMTFDKEIEKEFKKLYRRHGKYISPSLYVYWLKKWSKIYSKKSILILFSEEMEKESITTTRLHNYLKPVFKHVGLDPSEIDHEGNKKPKKYNTSMTSYALPKDTDIKRLSEIFREPNKELALWLGRKLPEEWL